MAIDYPTPPSYVTQFLMSDEGVVVALRRHPVQLLRPILLLLLTTSFALWSAVALSAEAGSAPDIIWLGWLGVFTYTLYRVWWWRRDWLVVTNKRLVTQSGIFSRSMPMMPLRKITDMSYRRSPLGLLLGYGNFVLESAGQDQALREVRFVPRPDAVYRAVIEEVFRGPGAPTQAEQTPDAPHSSPSALRTAWLNAWSRLSKGAWTQLKNRFGSKDLARQWLEARTPQLRHRPTVRGVLLGRPHNPTPPEEIEARARLQGRSSSPAGDREGTVQRDTTEIHGRDHP